MQEKSGERASLDKSLGSICKIRAMQIERLYAVPTAVILQMHILIILPTFKSLDRAKQKFLCVPTIHLYIVM